jgi:molecular chaperone GrpE
MDERESVNDPDTGAGSETATDENGGEAAVSGVLSESAAWQEERETLQTEKAELQDRVLRQQAEFQNYRRRMEREKAEAFDYGRMESVREMLSVVDDFERALGVECADKEFLKGVEMIRQRFLDTLQKQGLEPIEALGKKFDPHVHHAIEKVEDAESEEDTVLGEFQKGYNFKGKLLRPAIVKVAVRP